MGKEGQENTCRCRHIHSTQIAEALSRLSDVHPTIRIRTPVPFNFSCAPRPRLSPIGLGQSRIHSRDIFRKLLASSHILLPLEAKALAKWYDGTQLLKLVRSKLCPRRKLLPIPATMI